MHILLIEDDLDLGRALQSALRMEKFSSEWLRRANDAPKSFHQSMVDCVLLDLSLPDGSGFDLLSRWRKAGERVPIIIITARSGLDERLAGLDGGADDFLVKPFATQELISRLRAILRREARKASDTWVCGELCIEPRRMAASLAGEPLELTPREFQLLLELARDAGAVVAKHTLAQKLDPLGDPLQFAAIEVHISNLRRKVGNERIQTVRGIGYLLKS